VTQVVNVVVLLPLVPSPVHLPASMAVIEAIEKCWSSDVFIYGLAHSFWKFTLQLLARYSIWITTNLANDLDHSKDRAILVNIDSLIRFSGSRYDPEILIRFIFLTIVTVSVPCTRI